MITPMRHVTLICRQEDRSDLLERLRDFGAVHVTPVQRDNHEIEKLRARISEVRNVMQKLSQTVEPGEPLEGTPAEVVAQCRKLEEEQKEIVQLQTRVQREHRAWEPFGMVQPSTLHALKNGGLKVVFYRSGEAPEDLPETAAWLPAATGFGVAVSPASLEGMSLAPLHMPVRGPERLQELDDRLQNLFSGHEDALAKAAGRVQDLARYLQDLEDELAYLTAHAGMEETEQLAWIEGFVPEGRDTELQTETANWGAAVVMREPEETDAAPTLLKQNAFVSWIQPVFEFLGVTPGYREVDVGASFLIFLSVFSGMIIGDAGYGLLLLALVAGLNVTKPATRGKFANLLYLMAGATVIWGFLTGNVFGISGIPPVFPALSATADPTATMNVCFILGSVHLTLAHGWNLWRNRRSLQALAELGWIGSTWTMYAIAGNLILGWSSLPSFILPLFFISIALVVIFMTPPKQLKEQWVDHMMLPLTVVNNFVDVVSYVRLYAVGMATFALASSFNAMLFPEGVERNLIVNGIMAIILVLGHALNFILAGMGVMVHGIRLNTLEFASHLGLTWSGIPFTPFKRQQETDDLTKQSDAALDPTL